MSLSLEYVKEVLDNGEMTGKKLLDTWNEASGKERLDFVITICSGYRALIKEVIKRVEERLDCKNK